MKYMGSKRSMLLNGLGEAIDRSVRSSRRVFDLFTGSGAVAWHIAQNYEHEVIATDIQTYAVSLSASVIERTSEIFGEDWIDNWFKDALDDQDHGYRSSAIRFQAELGIGDMLSLSTSAGEICKEAVLPISCAYGGHYFSPLQALWLDTLRRTLPQCVDRRKVGIAALVIAASQAAAAPGHTAQPFKPNRTAGPFLKEAWMRDVLFLVRRAAIALSTRYALTPGRAIVSDANEVALQVGEGDLVFIDPPYSGVHYSRFYHVLETVAIGAVGPVSGTGRYPPATERPRSRYSLRTESRVALDELLRLLSERGASAIMTFPAGNASNGLTGADVIGISENHFSIGETKVSSRFSTLGGDKKHRAARKSAEELILVLTPR